MTEKLTLQQISDKIAVEKSLPDRWLVRIIFTHSLAGYNELTTLLRNNCDISVSLSDDRFTTGNDTLPNFNRLKTFIGDNSDKTILLTDVSEYLRLCVKKETSIDGEFRGIWEQQTAVTSLTRIIIPLFGCDDLFARIVPSISERQEKYIWCLSETPDASEYSVSVYSLDFKDSFLADVMGIKAWLASWVDLWAKKANCSVVTKFIKYAEEQRGDVSLKIVDDPFSYAKELFTDGDRLKKDWFRDWPAIAEKVHKGCAFSDFIKKELGVSDFDFSAIAPRWNNLSELQRQYIWVWYRLYQSENYIDHVVTHSEKANDIPLNVRDNILEVSNAGTAWINERNKLLALLPFVKSDNAYLTRLGKLPLERQIELLGFVLPEEQAYGLELIGKMLLNGASAAEALSQFGERFSLANDYFNEVVADTMLRSYLRWYKESKLKNRSVDGEIPYVDADAFDSRHKLLAPYDNADSYFLWVDGLGVEWGSLLYRSLEKRSVPANIVLSVGKAMLPTETEFNKCWNSYSAPYNKLDRLDKLAHTGVPDNKSYFACIAAQYAIISEIADEAARLIDKHNNVLIVGDHGSSRLNALSFHSDEGVVPAKNWEVKNHGRFCLLPAELPFDEIPSDFEQIKIQGNGAPVYALVSKTYAHFKQSGNAPFETHGGATPEESLVSVLVLSRQPPLPKPSNSITKMRGIVNNEMGL